MKKKLLKEHMYIIEEELEELKRKLEIYEKRLGDLENAHLQYCPQYRFQNNKNHFNRESK